MAIRVNPSASSSRTQEYLHTERQFDIIKKPDFDASECCFCVPNCDWDFPAFALLTDQNDRQRNDRSPFYFEVPSGGTITATLIQLDRRNNAIQSITIVDNTYGNYFATGTIKANYWGFILDWYKVANVIGFGRFKLNIVIENGSSTEVLNEDSVCFHLMPWTCENAHRTVKITTEQSGYFENGINYEDLSFTLPIGTGGLGSTLKTTWPQELRLFGVFYREGFPTERDNLVTQDRGQELVQSKIWKKYKLKLDTIPTKLSNFLIFDMLQASEVYITDQNISNIENYTTVRVDLQEIDDPINFRMNKNEFIEITFVDWEQSNVHRFR